MTSVDWVIIHSIVLKKNKQVNNGYNEVHIQDNYELI